MKSPNQNTLLVSLMAALALYFPLANVIPESAQQQSSAQQSSLATQTVPPASPKPKASQTTLKLERQGAAKLLCDFFGLQNQGGDNHPNDGDYCHIAENIPEGYQIEHIIATIPDTKESRMDYLFDRNLDAIQRAVEATGYVLDRYSLPWGIQKNSLPPTITLPSQPATVTLSTQGAQPQHDYRREPGIILFRNIRADNNKYNLLLIFLVGETPTTGIHKIAFRNALDQIKQLPQTANAQRTESGELKIRVMGPTFSGSSTPLAFSIKSWLEEFDGNRLPQVQIISGSATAMNKRNFLQLIGDCANVTFNATVPLDTQARSAFIEYLKDIQAISQNTRPEIAILAEANTAYGREGNPNLTKVRNHPKPDEKTKPTKASLTCLPDKDPETPESTPSLLSLTFPLHISQLRSEAAKLKSPRNEAANKMPPQNVALPMSEGGEPKASDVIPLFSPLEIASTEQVLGSIFSAIDREPIRYIGLIASDVQDRIFLVHELRSYCPNAVIFTFGTDVLYLHSEANLDFQGTMVISPYPLFSFNQLWSYPFRGNETRLQFPTQTAQGAYNAILALMGETDKMVEYGSPFDLHWKEHFHKPVLWLSVVGRNGIWPVKILGEADAPPGKSAEDQIPKKALNDQNKLYVLQQEAAHKSYTYPIIPKGDNPPTDILIGDRNYSSLSVGAMLLISLLCLIPSSVLLLQLIRLKIEKKTPKKGIISVMLPKIERFVSSRWINQSWLGRIFGWSDQFRHYFDRTVYLFACCVSLLIISVLISSICLLPDRISFEQMFKWERHVGFRVTSYAIFLLTLTVLLIVTGWLVVNIFRWLRQGDQRRWSRTIAILTLSVGLMFGALAFVVWTFIFYQARNSATGAVLFYLRATDLKSGVSVALPWIFVGVAMFLSFFNAVLRLDLAERMPCLKDQFGRSPEHESFLNFDAPSFVGINPLEDKVNTLLIGRIFAIRGAFLMIALIGLPYYNRFVANHIPSVEGRPLDYMFIAAFFVVPLLLSWAFLRFVWLSLSLRRLLKRLAWHPLFNAPIDKEDPEFQMLPRVNLMSPTPTYAALASSITQAKEFFSLIGRQINKDEQIEKVSAWPNPFMKNNWKEAEEAERKLKEAIDAESDGRWQESLEPHREAQKATSEASKSITEWMEPHWVDLNDKESNHKQIIKKGRVFMLGHVAAFLQHVLVHLQNLAGLVTVGLLLILLAANSYPFQPREPLLLFSWISILIAVAVTLAVFIQLSRDKVLSLFSGTTPGDLNWTRDLVFRVLIHGVIPIIVLLGAQFPQALRNILSWFSFLQGDGK